MPQRESLKDVVVLLPGLLGSVLQKDRRDLWAPSAGSFLRGLLTHGRHFDGLLLREDPPERDDLGDGVVASRVMPDVHLVPGLWKIDGYSRISTSLRSAFDLRPGWNYFELAYDWRRDVRVAARRLRRESHDWLRRWREASGHHQAGLVLVAHSLGGLVARTFLEMEDGARDTRALVTFGTPFQGAMGALGTLANGVRRGPFGGIDLTGLARSLTSLYQLLPVYPCYDAGDGTLSRVAERDDVPNVDAARARAALSFHRELADLATAASGNGRRDTFWPVVGIAQPTPQSARRKNGGVELVNAYEGADLKGDGTVPRLSAAPAELPEVHPMFAGTRHASLQNADEVLLHLAGILSGLGLDSARFRAEAPPRPPVHLGLDLEDAYVSDEPIRMRITSDRSPVPALTATLTDLDTRRAVSACLRAQGRDEVVLEAPRLSSGIYRVKVEARPGVEPRPAATSDVFVVFDRA